MALGLIHPSVSGWQKLFFLYKCFQHLDCQTVGFFLKISKEIGKAWRKSLTRAKRAASHALRACEGREKKPDCPFCILWVFLASLHSLTLRFQPRSRPFVWLLALTWISKNTDCFAVYPTFGGRCNRCWKFSCYLSLICSFSNMC